MKLLENIYKKHSGKVTDRWSIYLQKYQEKFNPYQELPIKLLEIGIQNGGSLEIYAKYFSNAELILGCNIDKKCRELSYNEPNIKFIGGDANEHKIKTEIILLLVISFY